MHCEADAGLAVLVGNGPQTSGPQDGSTCTIVAAQLVSTWLFYFSLLLSCLQLVMAILTDWTMSFCLFQLPQSSSMLPWPFETKFCESLTNIMEGNMAIVFCRWFVRKYFLSSRFYHAHISRRVKARFPPSEKFTFCCGSRLYRTFSNSSMAGILMFSGSHLWSIRTYSCHYFHSYFARKKIFFRK